MDKKIKIQKGNAKWIRKIRGKMSQQKFANKLGIFQARLSRLETGKLPFSFEIAYRLHKLAKVSPKKIFSEYEKSIQEGE